MNLSITQKTTKNQGFTIVELLIVVVVIAILAAITIVSYNGITNRANDSSAESLASTWRKKAELYYAENSRYPVAYSELNSASSSYYIANTSLKGSNPDSTDGKNRVWVQACAASGTTAPTTTTVAAIKIVYYNYDGGTVGPATITLGTTTATGTGCTTFS